MKTFIEVIRCKVGNSQHRKKKIPVLANSKKHRFQHDGSRCDEQSVKELRNGLPLTAVSIDVSITGRLLTLYACRRAGGIALGSSTRAHNAPDLARIINTA